MNTTLNTSVRALQLEARSQAAGPSNNRIDVNNPEEAAKSFEKVLVQEFVNVMTEQMFKSNLSGEDGPGWMKAHSDNQRQILSDILTDHLVESGTFDISSIVLKQWQQRGLIEK